MVIDDALGVAGGARRVVERDRVPFVAGQRPGEAGIAAGEESFVGRRADPLAWRRQRVLDVDHIGRLALEQRHRLADNARELAIDEQDLGLAMLEDEGDGLGVEPHVERVEHGAGHRHAKMRLDHGRRVRQHGRDRLAGPDVCQEC